MKLFLTIILTIFAGNVMAYDLHIENSNKSVTQWLEFVSEHCDLEIQQQVKITNPDTREIIVIETPNGAIAKNGLFFRANSNGGSLVISITDPQENDIAYLKNITTQFGGILVGDEGEVY